MVFDYSKERTLSVYYNTARRYKAEGKIVAYELAEKIFAGTNEQLLAEYLRQYYLQKGIDVDEYSEEELPTTGKEFMGFFRRGAMSLLGKFKVDYITQGFYDSTIGNVEGLVNSASGIGYYELLGESSGLMVLPEYIFSYWILEDGAYFSVSARDMSVYGNTLDEGGQTMFFGKESFDYQFKWDQLSPSFKAMAAGIAVLILKKHGEVETQVVAPGVRRKSIENDEMFTNKAPFPIVQVDSTWLRTIVRTEGFMVRGHFRLQPYGEGRLQRKLIYIEPFEKHGYTRRAKKLIEEEKQGE